MTLVTARYLDQLRTWPPTGRHVMAQYDASTVVVYQAYRARLLDLPPPISASVETSVSSA